MPVVRTSFMMGCVVVEVTWTSGARPRRGIEVVVAPGLHVGPGNGNGW
jgi:hypothetical protein